MTSGREIKTAVCYIKTRKREIRFSRSEREKKREKERLNISVVGLFVLAGSGALRSSNVETRRRAAARKYISITLHTCFDN